jgi:hypothetical protein
MLTFFTGFCQKEELIGTFSYRFSDRPDGTPSKCDCDFIYESLTLNKDGTFMLKSQKGHLDPKTDYYYGTWRAYTFNEEKRLNLDATHVHEHHAKEKTTNTKYWNFTVDEEDLFDDYHHWEGTSYAASQNLKALYSEQ